MNLRHIRTRTATQRPETPAPSARTIKCQHGHHDACTGARVTYSAQYQRKVHVPCGCPCHRHYDGPEAAS